MSHLSGDCPLILPDDEVHLWYVHHDLLTDPEVLAGYLPLLTPEERVQQQRFGMAKDRHQYLVARAFVRNLLSRYIAVRPEAWTFVKNAYGRPEIAAPATPFRLRFNLSHTQGLIVCGLAVDRDIGVDVENVTRKNGGIELADRYFSPSEVADLRARPPREQRDAFFDYWTMKEAYIKARGMGLALPLDRFSFHFEADRPVRISFDPQLPDEPTSWQFAHYRLGDRHKIAVAARRPPGNDLVIHLRETVP